MKISDKIFYHNFPVFSTQFKDVLSVFKTELEKKTKKSIKKREQRGCKIFQGLEVVSVSIFF